MRNVVKKLLVGGVALMLAFPIMAHHSFGMFDTQKQVTLSGTVKQFQFNNPHCFIQLMVVVQSGVEEWSVEMGAPAHLIRSGWKPGSLKPGDKVMVVINPLRDGSNGGSFVSATGENGKPVGSEP